jgi:predicted phage terminase large subunit-like protein
MGLLMEPLKHIGNKGFGAVILRRTYPQIMREGGMWDDSMELYPLANGTSNISSLAWNFPSGAKISFAHIQHGQDVEGWKGAQIPLIMFDQLEEHPERVFFYMLSRNRSTCGVKPYMRATVNPDPESWVARFIAWWIDQDTGLPIPERAGVVRWFAREANKWLWADTKEALLSENPHLDPEQPKSLTFIPARLEDNPILMQKDPGYRANLLAQDYVDQQRLLYGNWKVRAEAGKVFNRASFAIVRAAPAGGEEGTGFDLAATEKKSKGDDPDYTAAVTMRIVRGRVYITDFAMVRVGPAEVDTFILNTAQQRRASATASGANYRVRWEREPGSSGKRDNMRLVQMLDGLDARGIRPSGDKVMRAKPLSAQAYANNVCLVEADWNEEFLRHYHAFPDGPHDDGVDAGSVVYNDMAMFGDVGGGASEEETKEAKE